MTLHYTRSFEKTSSGENDIFQDLLSSSISSHSIRQPSSFIPGEHVSVTITKNNGSNFSLLQAHIDNNTLLVCQRSKVTSEHSLSVYLSSRNMKYGECRVPLFPETPVAIYPLSVGISRPLPKTLLAYRPAVLHVVCSDSNFNGNCDAMLTPNIYSKLFGSELTLSGSPVLLLGCQNGHVMYSSISQIAATLNPSSPQQPLPIIYSLGQPVQSIHAIHLPDNDSNFPTVNTSVAPPQVPNSLLLIGRLGKLVLCTMGAPQQRTPSFLEFNTPGPITSSVFIKNHALMLSTPAALYKVCMEEDCIRRHCFATGLVIIPEMRFRLPSEVAQINRGTLLLGDLKTITVSGETALKVVCVSLDGSVTVRKIARCCGEEKIEAKDQSKLTKELKECLRTLESTSFRLDELSKKREQQESCLPELSRELASLCDIARTRNVPGQSNSNFQVRYQPKYINIGVKHHEPCIDVCLTYTGAAPLPKGWSLLVQTRKFESHRTSSQLVPLASLQPKNEVSLQVLLADFATLHYNVCCYVHYDASHLLNQVTAPTTLTILLYERSLDFIDFLLPSQLEPRQVPWIPLRPTTTPYTDAEDEFPHYKDVAVSMDAVAKVSATHKSDIGSNARGLYQPFLGALLARQDLIDLISYPEPDGCEVILNSYDGSKVCLQTGLEDGSFVFSVYSTSETALCEAVNCIQRKINSY